MTSLPTTEASQIPLLADEIRAASRYNEDEKVQLKKARYITQQLNSMDFDTGTDDHMIVLYLYLYLYLYWTCIGLVLLYYHRSNIIALHRIVRIDMI